MPDLDRHASLGSALAAAMERWARQTCLIEPTASARTAG